MSGPSGTEQMYMASSQDELERFLANARGTAATAKIVRLDHLHQNAPAARWDLGTLRGRLVELSARGATATLTAAIELVTEAQTQSEPVAWHGYADSAVATLPPLAVVWFAGAVPGAER